MYLLTFSDKKTMSPEVDRTIRNPSRIFRYMFVSSSGRKSSVSFTISQNSCCPLFISCSNLAACPSSGLILSVSGTGEVTDLLQIVLIMSNFSVVSSWTKGCGVVFNVYCVCMCCKCYWGLPLTPLNKPQAVYLPFCFQAEIRTQVRICIFICYSRRTLLKQFYFHIFNL